MIERDGEGEGQREARWLWDAPRRRATARRSRSAVARLLPACLALACEERGDMLGSANADGAGAGGTASGRAGAAFAGAGGALNAVGEGEAPIGSGGMAWGDLGSGASSGAAGSEGEGSVGSLSPRLARYHRADADRSLRFELDTVEGLGPYPASLEFLTPLVGRLLAKPDGVSFDHDETLPAFGEEHIWTFSELDAFSRLHASDDADGPVSIHVLFIDGRYDSGEEGSGTVLGLAWGQRFIALFQDAIRAECSGVLGPLQTETCEVAERSVWAHEIGHVIGLVDNGLVEGTPHRDPDHGHHDVSDGCLMYWAYDSPEVFDVLLSRLETGQSAEIDFCEHCWADLSAVQR